MLGITQNKSLNVTLPSTVEAPYQRLVNATCVLKKPITASLSV